MSHSVGKKEIQEQHLQQQQQQQHARDAETEEHHSSANASAGLNLNLGGALSGALNSMTKKTTHQNNDGSSDTVEEKFNQGTASAAAQGHGNAYAAGNAEDHNIKSKERGVGQEATQTQATKGKQVDHLGIEA